MISGSNKNTQTRWIEKWNLFSRPSQTRASQGTHRTVKVREWEFGENKQQQQRRHINTTLNILIKIIWRTFLEGLGSTLSLNWLGWCVFFTQFSWMAVRVCAPVMLFRKNGKLGLLYHLFVSIRAFGSFLPFPFGSLLGAAWVRCEWKTQTRLWGQWISLSSHPFNSILFSSLKDLNARHFIWPESVFFWEKSFYYIQNNTMGEVGVCGSLLFFLFPRIVQSVCIWWFFRWRIESRSTKHNKLRKCV